MREVAFWPCDDPTSPLLKQHAAFIVVDDPVHARGVFVARSCAGLQRPKLPEVGRVPPRVAVVRRMEMHTVPAEAFSRAEVLAAGWHHVVHTRTMGDEQ